MSKLILLRVTHEMSKKRSLALLAWDEDQEKTISVPIPFGCPLAAAMQEAEKAVRVLADEMKTIAVTADESLS